MEEKKEKEDAGADHGDEDDDGLTKCTTTRAVVLRGRPHTALSGVVSAWSRFTDKWARAGVACTVRQAKSATL